MVLSFNVTDLRNKIPRFGGLWEWIGRRSLVPQLVRATRRGPGADVSVAGPLIYYTNAASEFVKGTMTLWGSFHHSNTNKGEVFTTLAPQLKAGLTAHASDARPGYTYLADIGPRFARDPSHGPVKPRSDFTVSDEECAGEIGASALY
jgi:hypothetical protein